MKFASHFPKTYQLLESAAGDVFPSYALGTYVDGANYFLTNNCGEKSLFDLASLTKVLCTTTIAAIAHHKGVLPLNKPLHSLYPHFANPRVHTSHLLNHSAGLPAWLALHAHFHEENSQGTFNPRTTPQKARIFYEREILKSWDPSLFENQSIYSDLGFLLLGWALEKSTDHPLDALFQEWIVEPSGLKSLQFLPTSPDVVPTEDCPWRRHVLRGEVHDDNCYVLGGVAGHAGLFGDIHDVLEMGKIWLTLYLAGVQSSTQSSAAKSTLIPPYLAYKFWTFSHVPHSTRVLGWDGVSAENSSAGRFFSKSSRGHLGYTGTSLWIDPEKKLVVTLLTNRVHPTRANEKIKAFRPVFHDTFLSEMGFAPRP